MRHHTLKLLSSFFNAVLSGEKTFELRFNDRDFQSGDVVLLKEFSKHEGAFTGRALSAEVGFVYKGNEYGLKDGYCIFSLLNVVREEDIISERPQEAGA